MHPITSQFHQRKPTMEIQKISMSTRRMDRRNQKCRTTNLCETSQTNFIKENQPWRYKKFPCLQDEWTDEIRNAEPPTFAKLRKLNRITQLEELYGHLLDQQNMDTNDTPNYEP